MFKEVFSQWYWIAAFIAVFIGLVMLTVYLCRTNKISKETISKISGVVSGMGAITATLAANEDSPVLSVANLVTTFVNKAVLAAENAYYNEAITKNDRREYCLDRLEELLSAYDITLSEEQWNVVDTMIAASCEEMGHERTAGNING